MALPPLPGLIDSRSIAIRANDLQSVTIRFNITTPPVPVPIQPAPGIPLTVLGKFTPQKTYLVPAIRYRLSLSLSVVGAAGLEGFMGVGFTPTPAAAAQGVSIGTSMLEVYENVNVSVGEYLNWVPYGWYLPVGKTVYVVGAATCSWNSKLRGVVQLYLLETFEQ